jgi:hypothetical protein
MSENVGGRQTRRWWAYATERPQWLIHITAAPTTSGWTVKLHALPGVCETYEIECSDGWEASEAVRDIMDSLDVMDDWTMSIG